MKRFGWILTLLLVGFGFALPAAAFDVLTMTPNFASRQVKTTATLVVVFAESLDPATVDDTSFFVAESATGAEFPGGISFDTTNLENDTVVFSPDVVWEWGRRYRLTVTDDVLDTQGNAFDGTLPADGLLVANIPNDFSLPNYDPYDPPPLTSLYNMAMVMVGFNPFDPESDAEPWEIPGVNTTEAWKYSTGNPNVLIALIDAGILQYNHVESRKNFFLNAAELPLPNVDGDPCAEYDCNGDGRFDVDDYGRDTRLGAPGEHDALDLIETFSDGFDDDGNGFVDDISGWDFLRNTNKPLCDNGLPLGSHGQWQMPSIIGRANNGAGYYVGGCPNCLLLPLRSSTGILHEFGPLTAAMEYASAMGASVISHAGANLTWSRSGHQKVVDAYDAGTVTVGVTCDEMSYHHWMPYAGEDAIAMKSIFPLPSVHYPDGSETADFAFLET